MYGYLDDSGLSRSLDTNLLLGSTELCTGSTSLPATGTLNRMPSFLDDRAYVVDLLDAANRPDIVDGGNGLGPESGLDVDRTQNDIGAMGGPHGERHYRAAALSVPAPGGGLRQLGLGLLVILVAIGASIRRGTGAQPPMRTDGTRRPS